MACNFSRAFGLPALMLCGVLVAGSPGAAVRAAGADAKAAAQGGKTVALNTRVTLPGLPGSTRAVGARSTSILREPHGEADNTPIPNARLRLRNVLSGKIAATTTANEMGQFAFNDVESGSYLVELVGENGKITAIGHAFTVAPGDTVATFVAWAPRSTQFQRLLRKRRLGGVGDGGVHRHHGGGARSHPLRQQLRVASGTSSPAQSPSSKQCSLPRRCERRRCRPRPRRLCRCPRRAADSRSISSTV